MVFRLFSAPAASVSDAHAVRGDICRSSPVQAWLAARIDIDPEAKSPTRDLYRDYCAWVGASAPVMGRMPFGMALSDLQFITAGRDSQGLTLRTGLRLRALPQPAPPPAPTPAGRVLAIAARLWAALRPAAAASAQGRPTTPVSGPRRAGR